MDAVYAPKMRNGTRCSPSKLGWVLILVLVLGGIIVLPNDVAIASFVKLEHKRIPEALDRPVRESLEICEGFGHGFGASLIIVAIGVLAPLKRSLLPWVIAGSLGSGLVANTAKLLIPRSRPRDFDLITGTVWNTFDREFSSGNGMQSFPSAHTATAVGLAVMLASLFPQGRWFFYMMAFLVGMQRIASSAHFPSDVCAGAVVGSMVGMICVGSMNSFRRDTLKLDV